jgi:NAD(P)-dependent dehydrogenase (short-subunit alcohol dehydrogenase family)
MEKQQLCHNHKTALITGGAKRLGAAMAVHLAEQGYNIVLHCCHSENDAAKTKQRIESLGVDCRILTSDFTSENDVARFIADAKAAYDHYDILINSAAVFDRHSIAETDYSVLDRMLAVNVKAPFSLIRGLAPIMDGGIIINITDAKIQQPDHQYAAYCLSKNALSYLTILASQEFAPLVRVNAIAPAYLLPSDNLSAFETFRNKIPLKDHIDIVHLLSTVDYLVNNKLITGQTITLDGGYYSRRMT